VERKPSGFFAKVLRQPGSTMKVLVAVGGFVGLAGCSATVTATDPTSFADIVAAAIQGAEADEASEAQLALLREAQSEGSMSIEGERAAVRAAVKCINDAGVSAAYADHTMKSGLVVPRYVASVDNALGLDATDAILNACDAQEYFWVDKVYQAQPTSVAVNDAYLDQQAPIVRACLEREGYDTNADATTHELLRQALDVALDTGFSTDCLREAEIDGF